jgi:hypothetical protein
MVVLLAADSRTRRLPVRAMFRTEHPSRLEGHTPSVRRAAMAISTNSQGPSRGTLSEVLQLILDRGLVIDAFVRVSLVGIEVLTIDARIVVASVDTYLRYAEAVGRLNLDTPKSGVPDFLKARQQQKMIEGAMKKFGDQLGGLLSAPATAPAPKEAKR